MRTEVTINNNMFTWAIARAGYELKDFVVKFPKIRDWQDQKKKPTVKELEAFSKQVHLPFRYLFLPEPPKENLPIPFFRTGRREQTPVSVNVFGTILLMQQRQDWLIGYLKENDFAPLPFVGRFRIEQNIAAIVADIRQTLDLPPEWCRQNALCTTVKITLSVDNVSGAMTKAIAMGATEISRVTDYEYGYRQGELKDPFGHQWVLEKLLNEQTLNDFVKSASDYSYRISISISKQKIPGLKIILTKTTLRHSSGR